jgi:sugar phosphate isomerase/epimerase
MAHMDEARRFIDLAYRLSCPYVRFFGGKLVGKQTIQDAAERIVAGFHQLHEHAEGSGVTLLKDRRYVLIGAGDVPVRETVRVLAAKGYRGYYSFEWEKRWHPEIEEPEISFPHYAKVMREYLTEAGVKQGLGKRHAGT